MNQEPIINFTKCSENGTVKRRSDAVSKEEGPICEGQRQDNADVHGLFCR